MRPRRSFHKAAARRLSLTADVTDPCAIDAISSRVVEDCGAASILVNAAGTFGPIQLVWKTGKFVTPKKIRARSRCDRVHAALVSFGTTSAPRVRAPRASRRLRRDGVGMYPDVALVKLRIGGAFGGEGEHARAFVELQRAP